MVENWESTNNEEQKLNSVQMDLLKQSSGVTVYSKYWNTEKDKSRKKNITEERFTWDTEMVCMAMLRMGEHV